MFGSASIDFDDLPPSSSDNSDEAVPEIHEMELNVPSAPFLAKSKIISFLMPYENIIQYIREVLLMKRPLQFLYIIVFVELFFLFVYFFDLGFFSCCTMVIFITVLGKMIYIQKPELFTNHLFPSNDTNDTQKTDFIDDFAYFLSVLGSRIYCFILACQQKSDDQSYIGRFLYIIFLFCIFLILKVFNTFAIIYISVHLILLLPSFIFHPKIKPILLPYVNRLIRLLAPKLKAT